MGCAAGGCGVQVGYVGWGLGGVGVTGLGGGYWVGLGQVGFWAGWG